MFDALPEKLNRPFKAVLFDLDGTLLDSEEIHYIAFKKAMEEFGYDFDEMASDIPYRGSFRELFMDVAAKVQLPEEVKDTIYERKLEITMELPDGELNYVDGAISFLELLQELNVLMGVVTNSDKPYADHILDTYELRPYFEYIITISDLSNPKPDPEGYLKAADMLSIDPADILVFENTDTGIAAAKEAGMTVIAIRTTDVRGISTYEEADHGIDDFADTTVNDLQFNI